MRTPWPYPKSPWRRLSIARALPRPRLPIFDEATSALDSLTEPQMTETVRAISRRHPQISVPIAHRRSTAMRADVRHVLERGRTVESGSHDELVALGRLCRAVWRPPIGERESGAAPEGIWKKAVKSPSGAPKQLSIK